MESIKDEKIIEQLFKRDDAGLSALEAKYGSYCKAIARQILRNDSDAEECVNDTWMKTWQAIPPERPRILRAFVGKITRNISLNRYHADKAKKRGGDQVAVSLEELAECLPAGDLVEEVVESRELGAAINRFLDGLDQNKRILFVRRYFYLDSVEEAAVHAGMSKGNAKVTLHRLRAGLKKQLVREELATDI